MVTKEHIWLSSKVNKLYHRPPKYTISYWRPKNWDRGHYYNFKAKNYNSHLSHCVNSCASIGPLQSVLGCVNPHAGPVARSRNLASSSLVVQLRFQLRFGNANAIGTLTKEQNCKFQLHLRFRGSKNVFGIPIAFQGFQKRFWNSNYVS